MLLQGSAVGFRGSCQGYRQPLVFHFVNSVTYSRARGRTLVIDTHMKRRPGLVYCFCKPAVLHLHWDITENNAILLVHVLALSCNTRRPWRSSQNVAYCYPWDTLQCSVRYSQHNAPNMRHCDWLYVALNENNVSEMCCPCVLTHSDLPFPSSMVLSDVQLSHWAGISVVQARLHWNKCRPCHGSLCTVDHDNWSV